MGLTLKKWLIILMSAAFLAPLLIVGYIESGKLRPEKRPPCTDQQGEPVLHRLSQAQGDGAKADRAVGDVPPCGEGGRVCGVPHRSQSSLREGPWPWPFLAFKELSRGYPPS